MINTAKLNLKGLKGTKDILTYYPKTLNDVEEILTALLNCEILVDITRVKDRDKQRFLDHLCGACFCLNKGICKLDKNVYLIIDKK
ncbi:MAG: cell division protein SepF [Clostridia bacterium]|nr:cell division protein SepF [Clostridia bacterium]